MKVLVICGMDATNFSLVNVVKKLINKKHEVVLYAKNLASVNVRMFKNICDDIVLLNEIDSFIKSDYFEQNIDCILSSNETMLHLFHCRKYIFSWSITSTFGTLLSEGADFLFTSGELKYEGGKRENCASMAVGDPKYDDIEIIKGNNGSKRFLFIDSGHYPFSKEGKRILANLLLEICYRFPEYTLVIKPRFLETDDENLTHYNKNHLYKNIRELAKDNIPSNLIMLQEYGDMNALIEQSETVLCMYSSAYVDVLVQGKGLIIIDGLPNEDIRELRNDWHWRISREECEKSGCLVNYHDVLDYLPYGKSSTPNYLHRQIALIGDSSEKIVSVMEYVYEHILKQNQFPKIVKHNCCSNEIEVDKTLTWERLIVNRKINFLTYLATRHIDQIDYRIGYKEFDDWCVSILHNWNVLNVSMNTLLREESKFIKKIKYEHKELLIKTAMGRAFFIEGAFEYNPQEILEMQDDTGLDGRVLDYYKGKIYLERGYNDMATKYFSIFLSKLEQVDFYKYMCDRNKNELFPFHKVDEGSRIVIYGAGTYGIKYGRLLTQTGYGNLVAYVDRRAAEIGTIDEVRVVELELLDDISFDYIVIAINNKADNSKVQMLIEKKGIPKRKIISYFL